jgi:hypothetical protein
MLFRDGLTDFADTVRYPACGVVHVHVKMLLNSDALDYIIKPKVAKLPALHILCDTVLCLRYSHSFFSSQRRDLKGVARGQVEAPGHAQPSSLPPRPPRQHGRHSPPPSPPPVAPSPPPPSPPPMWCTDTCAVANNSACQDGGSGSLTARFGAQCSISTDCTDCGARYKYPPSSPPPSPSPPPPSQLPTAHGMQQFVWVFRQQRRVPGRWVWLAYGLVWHASAVRHRH